MTNGVKMTIAPPNIEGVCYVASLCRISKVSEDAKQNDLRIMDTILPTTQPKNANAHNMQIISSSWHIFHLIFQCTPPSEYAKQNDLCIMDRYYSSYNSTKNANVHNMQIVSSSWHIFLLMSHYNFPNAHPPPSLILTS